MSSTVDQIRTEIGDLESYLAGLPDALRTGAHGAAYRSRLDQLRDELVRAELSQEARPAASRVSNLPSSVEQTGAPGSPVAPGMGRASAGPSRAEEASPIRTAEVMKLAKSIGAAARQGRTALELTQEDAAERLQVSVDFYARIERGNSLPSVPTLARMVAVLGVSADALLGRMAFTLVTAPGWTPEAPPTDPPEVRRVARMLRRASPAGLRLVTILLKELERHTAGAASAEAGAEDAGAEDAGAEDAGAEDGAAEQPARARPPGPAGRAA
jgi:transcriptional regulator with XRE-family HTH domain